jgi:hypothetical protein
VAVALRSVVTRRWEPTGGEQTGTLRRHHVGLATVVLTFLLTSISPAGAQEAPTPDDLSAVPTGTSGLAATQRVQANKAPRSSLAKTDRTLLARNDAGSTRVMIELDYDSIAAYQGGVDGLAATPTCRWRSCPPRPG